MRRRILMQSGTLALLLGTRQLVWGATILAVRIWPAPDYSRVTIESDTALKIKQFFVPSPPRLAVDIEGIELNPALKTLVAKVRADDPTIAGIRVGQSAPGVVRLVLDLKQPITPQVFTLAPVAAYQHRLVFDLYPTQTTDPLEALIAERLKENAVAQPQADPLGDLIAQQSQKPPEPIIKQDGDNKNDCERNAAKRLLPRIREQHPSLQLIVVEDGLASNAPHIRLLQELNFRFLLVAHPEDHEHLFEAVTKAHEEDGRVTVVRWKEERDPDVQYEIRFVHDLPLNKSNPDVRVNFLHYVEYGPEGEVRRIMSWVTDLIITVENAPWLVRGGRARWKIENETFNTMKNQGYHFEHNYGHGEQHLSVVFAMLMMLAFLVDQTQQICCPLFQAVHKKLGSKRFLWELLRSHFYHFEFSCMRQLYEVILYDLAKELPLSPGSLSALHCVPLLNTASLLLSEP